MKISWFQGTHHTLDFTKLNQSPRVSYVHIASLSPISPISRLFGRRRRRGKKEPGIHRLHICLISPAFQGFSTTSGHIHVYMYITHHGRTYLKAKQVGTLWWPYFLPCCGNSSIFAKIKYTDHVPLNTRHSIPAISVTLCSFDGWKLHCLSDIQLCEHS